MNEPTCRFKQAPGDKYLIFCIPHDPEDDISPQPGALIRAGIHLLLLQAAYEGPGAGASESTSWSKRHRALANLFQTQVNVVKRWLQRNEDLSL